MCVRNWHWVLQAARIRLSKPTQYRGHTKQLEIQLQQLKIQLQQLKIELQPQLYYTGASYQRAIPRIPIIPIIPMVLMVPMILLRDWRRRPWYGATCDDLGVLVEIMSFFKLSSFKRFYRSLSSFLKRFYSFLLIYTCYMRDAAPCACLRPVHVLTCLPVLIVVKAHGCRSMTRQPWAPQSYVCQFVCFSGVVYFRYLNKSLIFLLT